MNNVVHTMMMIMKFGWFYKAVVDVDDADDCVDDDDDLQDPVIGSLRVKNVESVVSCESNQTIGQDMPVPYSHPRYLKYNVCFIIMMNVTMVKGVMMIATMMTIIFVHYGDHKEHDDNRYGLCQISYTSIFSQIQENTQSRHESYVYK